MILEISQYDPDPVTLEMALASWIKDEGFVAHDTTWCGSPINRTKLPKEITGVKFLWANGVETKELGTLTWPS